MKLVYIALFICATTLTSCSQTFWDSFVDGYNYGREHYRYADPDDLNPNKLQEEPFIKTHQQKLGY
ncbi:MAG: hypothetical protein II248_06295 [Paludibacteraceae bacterium]|nr:hypothetical protein [Paludibacteraceae bacterium]